jgi:hypothetical protein
MPTKTLAQKLYIRPGYTVALLNAPKGMADTLAPLPDEVKIITNTKEKPDLALIFVKTSAELEMVAKSLKDTVDGDTVLWFAYPKLSSKTASDLSRDNGWKMIYDMGYQGVAAVAIDDVWSGLRFKRAAIRGDDELLEKQYTGARAEFRPLFDQISSIVRTLGDDVEMNIRQSYVAFSRGRQFALAKPANDRLDLVLKLASHPLGSRLIEAPGVGSGAMTHRVALTNIADIDREVVSWLQDAYRLAGR